MNSSAVGAHFSACLLERRVREAMESETEPLVVPGKVKTFTPKAKKILESLERVMAMSTDDPHRRAFSRAQ